MCGIGMTKDKIKLIKRNNNDHLIMVSFYTRTDFKT